MKKQLKARIVVLAMVFGAMAFMPMPAVAESYLYDELGRLIQVTYADDSKIEYIYDAAGNRIRVQYTCVTDCTQLSSSRYVTVAIGGAFYLIPVQ